MKKQIALVLTLAAFLIASCDPENSVSPAPSYQSKPEPVVSSIHPNAGESGSTMVIFGENFGSAISDNYVTFGSSSAEVTYVSRGMITVRVPHLEDGDYEISVYADGQLKRAPQMFTIINSKN